MLTSTKIVLLSIGVILSVIGIFMNNWKISAIGNLVAIIGISNLF